MEDPIERTFEYSGNFENDYLDGCKLHSITPFQLAKTAMVKLGSRSGSNSKTLASKKSDAALDAMLNESVDSKILNSDSRFKFSRKINVLPDEDDEVIGLQVRGWVIPLQITDVLVNSILASLTVSSLCLWNCGLNDAQANILLQLSNCNIRELFIDQNPDITETIFAGFIGDDSNIKTLSARSNNIGDAGAKAIAAALKVNHSLTILNLWDNRIRRDGAEAIADSLKGNQSLLSLSLGNNYIDDSAISAFGKVLSNQILSSDEVQIRRKVIAEWEKRRELEDKQKKGSAAPPTKSIGKGKDDQKKAPQSATAKGGKKIESLKPPKSPEKKIVIDEKSKTIKDVKKNGVLATPLKVQRKSSMVEDVDGSAAGFFSPEPQPYSEPMYEINGQWNILGNRTIINLDFSSNEITEIGLNALSDAISIQEVTNEIATATDGLTGLYRLNLFQNKFDLDHPTVTTLNNVLNKRNPFYESLEGALSSDHLRLSQVSAGDRKDSTV